jgi:hypothetical protein
LTHEASAPLAGRPLFPLPDFHGSPEVQEAARRQRIRARITGEVRIEFMTQILERTTVHSPLWKPFVAEYVAALLTPIDAWTVQRFREVRPEEQTADFRGVEFTGGDLYRLFLSAFHFLKLAGVVDVTDGIGGQVLMRTDDYVKAPARATSRQVAEAAAAFALQHRAGALLQSEALDL